MSTALDAHVVAAFAPQNVPCMSSASTAAGGNPVVAAPPFAPRSPALPRTCISCGNRMRRQRLRSAIAIARFASSWPMMCLDSASTTARGDRSCGDIHARELSAGAGAAGGAGAPGSATAAMGAAVDAARARAGTAVAAAAHGAADRRVATRAAGAPNDAAAADTRPVATRAHASRIAWRVCASYATGDAGPTSWTGRPVNAYDHNVTTSEGGNGSRDWATRSSCG